jgi:DNA-binding transcriptional MerR regulator
MLPEMLSERNSASASSYANKSPNALRTIGEVSQDLGIASHVLRFWESKFKQIKPQKRRGRRYYRPEDVTIIQQIKTLLYQNGYTIRGVQRFLSQEAQNIPFGNDNEMENKAQEDFCMSDFISPTDEISVIFPNSSPPTDKKELKALHHKLQQLRNKLQGT